MILQNIPQGIQGAKAHALLTPSRQAIVSFPAYRQTQSQLSAVGRFLASRRDVQGLCSAQANSSSRELSAPEADAAPTHAIVLGASVAGLLSAAALSDYVESVTVLDKDTFVSERLSHDQLKQVTVVLSAIPACGSWCASGDTACYYRPCIFMIWYLRPMMSMFCLRGPSLCAAIPLSRRAVP